MAPCSARPAPAPPSPSFGTSGRGGCAGGAACLRTRWGWGLPGVGSRVGRACVRGLRQEGLAPRVLSTRCVWRLQGCRAGRGVEREDACLRPAGLERACGAVLPAPAAAWDAAGASYTTSKMLWWHLSSSTAAAAAAAQGLGLPACPLSCRPLPCPPSPPFPHSATSSSPAASPTQRRARSARCQWRSTQSQR